MIIVEGPDGAGKTTLCKAISAEFHLELVAPQRGGEAPIVPVRNRVYRALGKAVQGRHPAKVYDRLFFSELVYGEVLRGQIAFSAFEQNYVNRMLVGLRCPVIMCLPSKQTCRENLTKNKQMEGVEENFDAIYEAYELVNQLRSVSMIHDYTFSRSENKVLHFINNYLVDRKQREY